MRCSCLLFDSAAICRGSVWAYAALGILTVVRYRRIFCKTFCREISEIIESNVQLVFVKENMGMCCASTELLNGIITVFICIMCVYPIP